MVSKYEGNYWLHDDVEAFTIEKDGQSLQQGKRYIYSYGKSGFVIIDKKNNTLKVLFDQQSNAFQKESFENQKALNPQYIQIITVTDLTETEKDMYTTLRNTDDGYKPSPQEEFLREWFAIPFLIQGWVSSSFGAFFLDGLIFWSLL